jgi:hypothetical protein
MGGVAAGRAHRLVLGIRWRPMLREEQKGSNQQQQ